MKLIATIFLIAAFVKYTCIDILSSYENICELPLCVSE